MTRRRDVGAWLGAASLAPVWPAGASIVPLIGILDTFGDTTDEFRIRRHAAELGGSRAAPLRFERRSVDQVPAQAEAAARELVALRPVALVTYGDVGIAAARAATHTIPIVAMGYELLGRGGAASLRRPGGNLTGVTLVADELDAKRLELLAGMLARPARVALIGTPATLAVAAAALAPAAVRLDIGLTSLPVSASADFPAAFAKARQGGARAILPIPSDIVISHTGLMRQLMREHRVPVMENFPGEGAEGDGLIGYGPDLDGCDRQLTGQLLRVIDGADPATLPIEQPTQIRLSINLKVARELGLSVPRRLQLRADTLVP